ncbi:hypothetical protein [Flavobacterium beibuense]|uniref:Glycosyltransferase RgtA/B/C/D-like domain-containing protein n=1 Tax=Flavobacterium beibuense TaxID=657326 RepID=A0A444WIA8_9FLAO|nr:hypothetical protein [Flavobacterium beibuense]RYJ45590.1 hypothetical protein NU09_0182 [Flavobacterium beibuense]
MKADLRNFTILIAILATIFYSFYEGWISYLILWLFSIVGTYFLLRFFKRNESRELFSLFLFTFSFYSIYMYITNYIYVNNPSDEFFMMVDSMKFWDNSNFKMYTFQDLWDNFNAQGDITLRYRLFNFISIFLSFFAQIFDENNILVQKWQSVYAGALSIPFIYLILKCYVSRNKAYKYSLFFSVLSFVCVYSIVFNRDPHVYFLYVLGTYYVVYHDRSKYVFAKLVMIFIFLIGFRIEHALFFTLFIMSYFYLKAKKNKPTILISGVLMFFMLAFLSPILFSKYEENAGAYENQMERVDRKEVSVGASFSSLPVGLKQLAMAINGQIAPAVPFWRGWYIENANLENLKHTYPGYYTPWRFMENVAATVWLYVLAIVFAGFYFKLHKAIPSELLVLFGLAVLLLLLSSSSINTRRVYCVYPIIYIVSVLFYNVLPVDLRKKIVNRTTLSVIGLYLLYFYIK